MQKKNKIEISVEIKKIKTRKSIDKNQQNENPVLRKDL